MQTSAVLETLTPVLTVERFRLSMATSNHTPRTIEIPLTKGYVAIVDEQDADLGFSHPKWVANEKRNTVYVNRQIAPYTNKVGTFQYLHILILERMLKRKMEHGEKVDHINGDGLDCRRENLRLASHAENIRNSKLSAANKTGYKGVMVIGGYWVAKITINAKSIQLGRYATAIEAGIAYNHAAIQYFGAFARLNPIEGWEDKIPQKLGRKTPIKRKSKSYYTRIRYQSNKWRMLLTMDGKQKQLAAFDTELEAKNFQARYIEEHAI